jgi:hypothetical protein
VNFRNFLNFGNFWRAREGPEPGAVTGAVFAKMDALGAAGGVEGGAGGASVAGFALELSVEARTGGGGGAQPLARFGKGGPGLVWTGDQGLAQPAAGVVAL